jgi:hypothetical protein
MIALPIPTFPLAEWDATNTALVVCGAGLILFIVFSRINARKQKRSAAMSANIDDGPRPELTPHERQERDKQGRGMHRDLESLAVEIEEMARRLSAQLEEQAIRLERLAAEADRQIARLEELTAAGRQSKSPAAPPAANPDPGPMPATLRSASSLNRPGETEAANPAAATRTATEATPPVDSLARNVYQLADAGLAPPEIARRLGEHVGKVELILALRAM